jgi:hypothetical protein
MDDDRALEVIQEDAPAIADDRLVAVAEAAEKRIEAMNKIKRLAIRMTGPQDWTDQGGKPFPWASGAEKIARLFGIAWRICEPTMEHEEGGHYSYTYKGTFTLAGASIEAIGVRSSKDGFFKKYDNGTELPPSAIDKGDVKKSAYTNLLGNGIMRILGMRNLSWADLAEAGIDQNSVSKVSFKKGGKQQDAIATEGSQAVETFITDIKMQTKKKDGSLMKSPLYKINAEGTEYKTFSETLAMTAKEAQGAGRKVKITYISGKYGNDAEAITFADEGPGGERTPGEEG